MHGPGNVKKRKAEAKNKEDKCGDIHLQASLQREGFGDDMEGFGDDMDDLALEIGDMEEGGEGCMRISEEVAPGNQYCALIIRNLTDSSLCWYSTDKRKSMSCSTHQNVS